MTEQHDGLREALKRVAVALKRGDVSFALGGGYAGWALGGPEPEHDVDFLVSRAEADRAAEVLSGAGLRVEHPPEDWLFKAFTEDGAMADVIFEVAGTPVEDPLLERAQRREVLSVWMPVLSATDLLATKLRALSEHACDLGKVLPHARALREQVDWEQLRAQTDGSAYAGAFLHLAEQRDIAPPA